MEAEKMHLYLEVFNIEQLLQYVVDLFHAVGMKKGVDVILDPSDETFSKTSLVIGDEGKLKQILCNLLSNAVKFMAEGSVRVRAWARKPTFENEILSSNCNNNVSEVVNSIQRDSNCMEFVFEVDTGKGITDKRYVFEDYVQVKESAAGHEGTGSGLGIVRSLVRLMGGEITIVDKDVGDKGTLFRFNAFLSACEADTSTSSPAHKRFEIGVEDPIITKPLKGKRFLLVEDDRFSRLEITHYAARLGARGFFCENGEEAWKRVCNLLENVESSTNRYSFNCILMDTQMPVMDGIKATRKIRETERNYGVHIPIIALISRKEEAHRMIEAGADGYIIKRGDIETSLSDIEWQIPK